MLAPDQAHRLTRKRFVVGGLAAGSAPLTYLVASAAGATEDAGRLFGVIERIDAQRRVVIRSDGQKIVELAADAALWRDEAVGLDSFRVGDEVTFEGEWDGRIFRATHMSSAYRYIDGLVRSRTGNIIELQQGRVHLSAATRARGALGVSARRLNDIATGDRVVGIGRWEPATKDVLALQVGVRA